MFCFKQGSKMFFKNIVLSFVLALQIAVSIFLVGMTAAKVDNINKGVSLFDGIKSTEGLYVMPAVELAASDFDVESYSQKVNGVKSISKIYSKYYLMGDKEAEFIYYDDFIVKNCRLPLSKGIWFDEFDDTQAVPVIINNESNGIKLGSEFIVDNKKYVVIGVLGSRQQYITFDDGGNEIDITALAKNYNKTSILFICPSSFFDKSFFDNCIESTNFFAIFDDMNKQEKEACIQKFNDIGFTKSISHLYANGQANVKNQLINLSPYIIITFLLALIGVASSVTLMMVKELKNFSVFYICGVPWKRIQYTFPFYMLYVFIFSIAFYLAIFTLCIYFDILSYYELLLTFKEAIILAIIFVLLYLVSVIPIKIIFKKVQPIDILHDNLNH